MQVQLINHKQYSFSKSGDYENMDANIGGTVADDDAIIYTIASNQVNAIRFMTATRTLIIGTAGGEFTVSQEVEQIVQLHLQTY